MTTLYKLTDQDGYTRRGEKNECLWGPNATHKAFARSGGLCSGQYIHAYINPHLAILLNPTHAAIGSPRLWEARGRIGARDGQLKVGCRSLTTIRELTVPVITTEQRVTFAILCVKEVCADERWNTWADKWLSGVDCSSGAARAAQYAAYAAAVDVANAAQYAAYAAYAAAAARAARAARAANAAANAANAAAYAAQYAPQYAANAARAAADAAQYAATNANCDLLAIVRKVFGGTSC